MTSPTEGTESPKGARTTGRTVVGLFRDRAEAEAAIRALKKSGFTSEQIGVATQERIEVATRPAESTVEAEEGRIVQDTAAGMAEGAAVGALTGGVIGGLVGLVTSLLVPGLGPLIVGGVLASTILGMGVGAATGGLIGALVGMGVPEEAARYFDAGLRSGGTLVTVTAPDGAPEAIPILERHSADLGPVSYRRAERLRPYAGQERRLNTDTAYAGPERRLAEV